VCKGAAYSAAVGFHGPEFDTETAEYPFVSVEHRPIFAVGVLVVCMKRIAVFHDKFAAAHQTKARPDFIAEFTLELK